MWGLLLTLVLITLSLVWLLQTNSGAKTTLSLLNSLTTLDIRYQKLSGSISDLHLSKLELHIDNTQDQLDTFNIAWNPLSGLFTQNIQIDNLTANNVLISPATNPVENKANALFDFRLPLNIDLIKSDISNIKISGNEGATINKLTIAARF